MKSSLKKISLVAFIITCFFSCSKISPRTKDNANNSILSPLQKNFIIYTDINPDVTKTGTSQVYNLDLNNDSTIDFLIETYYSGISFSRTFGVRIYSMNMNKVACNSYPLAMNSGDSINSNLNWVNTSLNGSNLIWHPPGNALFGNWTNQADHYLGLKLIKGSNTYYGWVRLSVISTSSFTIKDYAYNSTPNQQILAGQTK